MIRLEGVAIVEEAGVDFGVLVLMLFVSLQLMDSCLLGFELEEAGLLKLDWKVEEEMRLIWGMDCCQSCN